MTAAEVAALVDRGLEIRDEIARLEKELKGIAAKLQAAGYEANKAGKVEDLKNADREGRRWMATGSKRIVPVIFTADCLVGSFTANSEVHKKIEAAAHGTIREFFKPVNKFENLFDDGLKFRNTAFDVIGAEHAPAFITACLARDKFGVPKSDVKIAWDKTEVKA